MYLSSILPTASASPVPDDPPGRDPSDEVQNWSSFIGIVTAIVGNVLIALALNVQRYAHLRLHQQRRGRDRRNASNGNGNGKGGRGLAGYGSSGASNGFNGNGVTDHPDGDDVDEARETDPLRSSFQSHQSGDSRWSESSGDDAERKVTSTYLKDPYWWLGQVLITVGEMGNFLAYGFAPASIVSPLGVVALISNCVIAPIVFKEVFRQRDFWGVLVAVAGAVTVVLSAKQEETKLEPHDVWLAITTMEFEIYMGISCALIIVLMWLSPRYGTRTILINLGLVGLFGGYTALATKGVSSMLSSTLLRAFTTPVTYMLVLVLLVTAVMQVRYVNKALQTFDSTQVIPIQFVLFTLSVIIGSAILYRDFERTTGEQAAKFVGGCLLTFFGVFLITSGRPRHDDDEDSLEDVEGVEETIGLAEQGPQTPQTPLPPSRRGSGPARSRRSSHISFREAVAKSQAGLHDRGVPTLKVPGAANKSRPGLGTNDSDDPSLLDSPWRIEPSATHPPPQHPGSGPHTVSSDSVVTVVSKAVSDHSHPGSPFGQPPPVVGPTVQAPTVETPTTPRASMSSSRPRSHHFGGQMYSPSPFSSTVSAVVADKLLAHIDNSTLRRISSRRSRPSLRNSLFVPQDEDGDDWAGEASGAGEQYRDNPLPQHVEGDEAAREDEAKKGFRGRARSLSHTLGELLGVRRKSSSKDPETEAESSEDNAGPERSGEPVPPRRGSTGL